jgi:dTDP-4-dehydrorhamnose reductase
MLQQNLRCRVSPTSRQHNPNKDVPSLELWGGPECTVNRVGDSWFDQTPRSGHEERIDDLALFADLGMRKLRYPALWERISPGDPEERDFRWTDERLPEIRRLGMDPILTLCHHGSGPSHTSLLSDCFSSGLARHAAAVAERYPWVQYYTPVNEPLTTARFSALYGYWYPHATEEGAFWTALLNQTDATRLAMRAIRAFNQDARLVQTDDLGFCHATAPLLQEANFQNERRWMGWDLLCGMVVPGHALWERLVSYGLEDRLRTIADDPCPPDVIGLNHYLSSERLLDHQVELHGDRAVADRDLGNTGGVLHVDVDAVRHLPDAAVGFANLIEQAWQRYKLPIAITECHLGSTREEQARWFIETWDTAQKLRGRGVDLRAVTAWSLLGAYDWNRMVTRFVGHYEPGVFDVRGGQPRPTLMAHVLKELADGRQPRGPGLEVPGWWRAERRKTYDDSGFELMAGPRSICAPQPLMIISDGGTISRLAIEACKARGLHYILSEHDEARAVRAAHPWAVLDARQGGPSRALEALGTACAELGIVAAVLVRADNTGEAFAPALLVAQTGPVFTMDDEEALAVRLLQSLEAGDPVEVRRDLRCDAVYGPSLVDGVLDLLLDGMTGVVRLAPGEQWSEAEFAQALALVADHHADLVVEVGAAASLSSGPVTSYLPPAETMLERFVRERCAAQRSVAWTSSAMALGTRHAAE